MTEQQAKQDRPRRKLGARDGLYKRKDRRGWWMSYLDADGRRRRQPAAPDYQTAQTVLRAKLSAIARGEALGVRGEHEKLETFVESRYWPTVRSTLSAEEQRRARSILNSQILPGSETRSSLNSAVKRSSVGRESGARRSQARRPTRN